VQKTLKSFTDLYSKRKTIVIYLFFFLSGLAGLIYEVVWGKYLALFIGSTTYAHTVVLAAFMGGISLGNTFFGKYADRVKNTFKLYGYLEIIIGIYCILFLVMVPGVSHLYVQLAKQLHLAPVAVLGLKFVFSTLLIIFPAFLMGGTLPVLTKTLTTNFEDRGSVISGLYFLNSLGAVIGGIFAGFFLIPILGLVQTNIIAVLINLIIGLVVLFLMKNQSAALNYNSPAANRELHQDHKSVSPKLIKLVLIIAGVTGFVSFLFELVWSIISF